MKSVTYIKVSFYLKKKNTHTPKMHILKCEVYLQSISYLQIERMRESLTLYNMTGQQVSECCNVCHRALYSTHFEGSVGKCFWQIVINLFSPYKHKKKTVTNPINNIRLYVTVHFYSHYHFRPECTSSGSRRWAHGRRVWRRSSHVQYERGYPPWSHRWAKERFL